jgi:hypothetical protein
MDDFERLRHSKWDCKCPLVVIPKEEALQPIDWLLRKLDELHLKYPFASSRMLRDLLSPMARLSHAPFAAADLIRQARRYPSRAALTRALRLVARADLEIRSSPPDKRLVLERLILALATDPKPTAHSPNTIRHGTLSGSMPRCENRHIRFDKESSNEQSGRSRHKSYRHG